MAKTKNPPKSEFVNSTDVYIRFADTAGNGIPMTVEKNVGQRTFVDSPRPQSDFLLISTGEDWFLSKGDAKLLYEWLRKALA